MSQSDSDSQPPQPVECARQKRPLTEAQLKALADGRLRSLQTRQKRAQVTKAVKDRERQSLEKAYETLVGPHKTPQSGTKMHSESEDSVSDDDGFAEIQQLSTKAKTHRPASEPNWKQLYYKHKLEEKINKPPQPEASANSRYMYEIAKNSLQKQANSQVLQHAFKSLFPDCGRGSGKTTLVVKLLKWYISSKSYDRLIVFSSTADRDLKVKSFIEHCQKSKAVEVTLHSDYKPEILGAELERMEADIAAYREFEQYSLVYKRFARATSVDQFSHQDLMLLERHDFQPSQTEFKYGFPCFCIWFDDMVGSRIFNQNMTGVGNRLLISHRHYSCSVIVCSQTFTNFLPKAIRNNNIGLWMLAGTKCDKTMREIADDVSSRIPPEKFVAAWKLATEKPHNFLVCNYDAKDSVDVFRVNLDKRLELDPAES
ncbi:TPA_asm: FtsK [Coelastrella green algae MELD virus]|nr:TPA_asm: FtsK [Coelastrella green algae MELD virus]